MRFWMFVGDRREALPTILSKGLPLSDKNSARWYPRRSGNSYAVSDPVFRGIGPQVANGTLRVFDVSGKGRLTGSFRIPDDPRSNTGLAD